MKRWIYLLGTFSVIVMLLTGCGQIEEMVGNLLSQLGVAENNQTDNNGNEQQQANESEENEENEGNEAPIEGNENNHHNNGDENDVDDVAGANDTTQHPTPFDDRLREQGYTLLTLPNGFPFEVPYHWVLVDDSDDGTYQFCYDLPLSIEKMNEHFTYFDSVSQTNNPSANVLHEMAFEMDFGYEMITGTMAYYLDDFENTCVTVTIDGAGEGGEWEGPGEDPATMADDDELTQRDESNHDERRDCQLVNGFIEWLSEFRQLPVETNEPVDTESIREKITAGEFDMFHLANGHPVVFPYEWYLLEKTDDHSGQWEGTYCTDAPLQTTIVKHLDMLEQLNANIDDYDFVPSPSMNKKAQFTYAFNDIYGTGSWQGESIVYIDRLQTYQTHKCIMVKMEFSADILQ